MQTQDKAGHVYLIHAIGTSRFKIGLTQQGRMDKRFQELNGSQSPYRLELVRVIDVMDRFEVEAELHRRFKRDRKHGEWFELKNGTSEVERVMTQLENPKVGIRSFESWRLMLLITGIILLLFAYQNHTRERSPSSPSSNGDRHSFVSARLAK